jgi:hypothetical protein
MDKIKEYLNKEMEHLAFKNAPIENNNKKFKMIDPIEKLKEDFNIWLENLSRSMHLCKYRQVLSEIESGKNNFELIPTEHWRYKRLQLKAIFKIIKRKLRKYSFEISKGQSQQNHSVLFWFNQSFLLLEQLILQYRDDINNIDLKSKEILKPIQFIYFGHIEFLYLLINYSYINGDIKNICIYLSLADRLSGFSGNLVNINALPLLQKIYLLRVKLCLANCDFVNGMKYIKKTIDLCLEQLTLIIDYDINLEQLENYEKDETNLYHVNKNNIKIFKEILVNITLAFYLRGVLSEFVGNVSNAIDSYKQSKFFSTKFLMDKYYNFTMFFYALQNKGITYLAVMENFKELREKKDFEEKIRQKKLERKKFFDKLNYEKNYNKFYSNINTKQNLYKGELKRFLDYVGDILYKEEQSRHSILNKFTKTTYITSTMKMINNLLSEDFKYVLKQIKKVEVTKPSLEVNSLINRALIKKRQAMFNENDKKNKSKKNKYKKNTFNKKTITTNYNTIGENNKTFHSTKNRKMKINYKEYFNSKSVIYAGNQTLSSKKSTNRYTRPFSVNTQKERLFLKLNNQTEILKKNRLKSPSSMRIIKNKFNKSESSMDTLDNEYSNKKYNYIDNSMSIAKNSFYLKNKSNNTIIYTKRRNQRPNSSKHYSYFDKKDKNDRNLSSILHQSNKNEIDKYATKLKNYLKFNINQKKEFRMDKENFRKDFLNKKIFLDKYCNEEIKFHRKLLASKSCELECTKEPTEFDLKKSKRDAELEFNKIFELCKSSSNKKNLANYIKHKNMGMSGSMTTQSDKNKSIIFSKYQINRENKKVDRILDDKEKKRILNRNEEKIEILNFEYENMIQKENEIKIRKKKLLESWNHL